MKELSASYTGTMSSNERVKIIWIILSSAAPHLNNNTLKDTPETQWRKTLLNPNPNQRRVWVVVRSRKKKDILRVWAPGGKSCQALQKSPRIRLWICKFNTMVLLIYSWNLQERRYVSSAILWPNNDLVQNNLRCFRAVNRCLCGHVELRKSWATKQQF